MTPVPVSSADVAILILRTLGPADMTPRKLQALVYTIHGWSLATYGLPACADPVADESHSPVFPELRNHLAHYGIAPLGGLATVAEQDYFASLLDAEEAPEDEEIDVDPNAPHLVYLVELLAPYYGQFTGNHIRDMVYRPTGPLSPEERNSSISDDFSVHAQAGPLRPRDLYARELFAYTSVYAPPRAATTSSEW